MFNKIVLATVATFSLANAVDDFSSERLLGIEVGYTTVNSRSEAMFNKSNTVPEFGLKLGAQNEEWRTTLHLNFMEAEGRSYQKAMIDFDRFVWASLYETDSIVFKPYLGAHIGWLRYTADLETDNGMAYGGQLGLALNVLNEVDFDLGYRYTVVDMPTVDDIGSFTFSVNYLY